MNHIEFVFDELEVKPLEDFRIAGKEGMYCLDEELRVCTKVNGKFKKNRLVESEISVGDILSERCKLIKAPNLTDLDKKARDYFLAVGKIYVGKDVCGQKHAFSIKPSKGSYNWIGMPNPDRYHLDNGWRVSEECFKFIDWENKEPLDLRTLE